jgi:tetratricopeptide (TPR) repeat protein
LEIHSMRYGSYIAGLLFAVTNLSAQTLTPAGSEPRLHVMDRDLPVPQLQRAEQMLRWGQSEEALLAYDAILAQRPGWIPALVARAATYGRLGQRQLAERDLTAARRLSPLAADFYIAGTNYSLLPFIALYPREWLDTRFGTREAPGLRSTEDQRSLLATLDGVEDPELQLIRNKVIQSPNQLRASVTAALGRRTDKWADFMLGNLALLSQDLLGARRYYNDAQSSGATWPELYYNRGITHILLYDYVRGCADLALSYQMGHPPALNLHTSLCTY